MLTTSVNGKAYDFNRVIGGRQFRGIISIALSEEDDIFVVLRDSYGDDIIKITVGLEFEDEEVLFSFRDVDENVFSGSWPSCACIVDDRLYVTDELKSIILVFNLQGELINSLGNEGSENGEFHRPSGIACDTNGDLYVSDTLNHRIQKITKEGNHITSWGYRGEDKDQLNYPWGICIDKEHYIYVSDHKNNRIQKFDHEGNFVLSIGLDSQGNQILNHPSDVTVDTDGDIYIADWINNRIQIFDDTGLHIASIKGSANELSKWQRRYVSASPDVYKARRRVDSLEPEKFFALPTCVRFDSHKSHILAVDSQRWRIQIFNKINDYSDPQFNI